MKFTNNRIRKSTLFIISILLVVSTVCIGVLANPKCPENHTRTDLGACIGDRVLHESTRFPILYSGSFSNPATAAGSSERKQRVSEGQISLLRRQQDPFMREGINAFRSEDFEKASEAFGESSENNPRDPEPLIYQNNSKAHLNQKGFYKLATVVPISDNASNAIEMLRGIAQAQDEFNKSVLATERKSLEIVIVDDGLVNSSAEERNGVVESVAAQIVQDEEILGIVGHNSSSATKHALKTYEKAGVSLVSPTSTSVDIKSDYFFRIPPSDKFSARELADYLNQGLGDNAKLAIFYDSQSSYSNSFMDEFIRNWSADVSSDIEAPKKHDMSAEDFRVSMSDLLNDGYNTALLVPSANSYHVAINIARDNRDLLQAGKNAMQLLGGDSLYGQDKLNSGGQSLEGLVLPVPWFSQCSSSQDFVLKGQARWASGTVNWRTAMSYDATQALVQTLDGDVSRIDIQQKLSSPAFKATKTSGEAFRFQSGEIPRQPVLIKVSLDQKNQSISEPKYELISNTC